MEQSVIHEIIADIKRVYSELGYPPGIMDYSGRGRFTYSFIRKAFGGWEPALKACGITPPRRRGKRQGPKWRYQPAKLDSITTHEIALKQLFIKYGMPKVIKMIEMPDTHEKHMDKKAVSAFLSFVKWYEPHIFMIMGDFIEAAGLSHWPDESMEPKRIAPEMVGGRALLERIVKVTPGATRIFLEGNHEDWIRQAMCGMPEMFQDLHTLGIDLTTKSLLNLDQYGFEFFPVNHFVKIGKCYFTHGVYAGDNHPKQHLMKLFANLFYGHTHDTKSTIETGIEGTREAHALGCLCRLDPKFKRNKPTNWKHAFGVHEFFWTGEYTFYKPSFKHGRLAVGGKEFK